MNFRALRSFLLSALAVAVIAGCDFKEGLERSPSRKFDPSLLGTWLWDGPGDRMNVSIHRKDDVFITGSAWPDSEPNKPERFTGYTTEVKGVTFLVLDFGKSGAHAYLLAQIERLPDGAVRYRQVDAESGFAKDSSGSMRERLERHLHDRDLYLPEKSFIRKS